MKRDKSPNVLLLRPGDRLPDLDDGDRWVAPKKGNDRMWQVVLFNRHRGVDRRREGTFTIARLLALVRAIKSRHPRAVKSPKSKAGPIIYRTRHYGPAIAIVTALDGPVASVATKQ